VEALVFQAAVWDKLGVSIWMEQEPGASGVHTIDHYRRKVLKGFDFRGDKKGAKKSEYWRPLSAAAEAGNVKLLRGPWINAFLDEAEAAPNGAHDDQLDAVSGAVNKLVLSEGYGGQEVW
jgi:predicted phage terminase large subunit-like protein